MLGMNGATGVVDNGNVCVSFDAPTMSGSRPVKTTYATVDECEKLRNHRGVLNLVCCTSD